AKPAWFQRLMNLAFGWSFKGFNWFFERLSLGYAGSVRRLLRVSILALVVYGGLLALTGSVFNKVPTGFVPGSDKGYLIAFAQLPDAASLQRSREVTEKMATIALNTPGVAHAVEIPGFNL